MITSNFDYNQESERYRLPEYDMLKRMAEKSKQNSNGTISRDASNVNYGVTPDFTMDLEIDMRNSGIGKSKTE